MRTSRAIVTIAFRVSRCSNYHGFRISNQRFKYDVRSISTGTNVNMAKPETITCQIIIICILRVLANVLNKTRCRYIVSV